MPDQAPPFPVNFWGTYFSPSAPAQSCGRREPEPRTEQIWLRQKCRSQWWKQLPGCKNCLCPTPLSPAGKGRHETITTCCHKASELHHAPKHWISERSHWVVIGEKEERKTQVGHFEIISVFWFYDLQTLWGPAVLCQLKQACTNGKLPLRNGSLRLWVWRMRSPGHSQHSSPAQDEQPGFPLPSSLLTSFHTSCGSCPLIKVLSV